MADMKDNPFFKIGALMGETNNKNIALQATIEAQEAEIKRLRDALQSVDDLWGGERGLREEMLACKAVDWVSPVYIVWRKIKAALKGE